jgi:hypothetical protein
MPMVPTYMLVFVGTVPTGSLPVMVRMAAKRLP